MISEMWKLTVRRWNSPCGALTIGEYNGALCLCDWLGSSHHERVMQRLKSHLDVTAEYGDSDIISRAIAELEEYLAGSRTAFDIPLLMPGTPWQQTVWRAIHEIGYGTTATYNQLAERTGHPSAIRASANATGSNAISIFVPCHRVIGSSGLLTGYAGGIDAKRRLLVLEQTGQLPD